MSYGSIADLDRYFENFGTNYYGTQLNDSEVAGSFAIATSQINDDLLNSYNKINYLLDSVARIPIVPVGTMDTGSHHPYLIEWNCVDTIFTKLKSRHSVEFRDGLPQWINDFGSRGYQILEDIVSGKITFDFDTTKSGIGYPTKIRQTGLASFYTNWDSGFFEGSDFQKTFRIAIDGTIAGNNIGSATFKISEDGGISYYTATQTTATTWIDISKGMKIRWSPNSLTGTQVQLGYNDEWAIICTPQNINRTSYDSQYKTFRRG